MLLIAFGHKARQGKDTAAIAMLEATPLDTGVHRVGFATALRKEVNAAIRQFHGAANLIDGFKDSGLMPDWVRAESWPDKQRTLLQWWGTEYRRKKDPDYWVKRFFEHLQELDPEVALVTDLRFRNEADAIRAAGGYLVKVERTTTPDVSVPEHESERALDGYTGWDYTLRAATVDELRTKAVALYHEIARKHASH